MNPLQRFGVFLANRLGGSTFAHDWGASGAAPTGEKKPRNPADAIGDPLRSLNLETVRNDYRLKINRGDLAFPTWALHEALRTLPIIGNYERMFIDAVSGMDYDIKRVEGADEAKAASQEDVLKKAYNALDVPGVVSHLARANLYGFSVLTRRGTKLDPLDWWNILRHGMNGGWYWNPSARSQVVREDMPVGDVTKIDPAVSVIREVRNACLLEYLTIFLAARETETYWDRFNERRSWNQVVLLLAKSPAGKEGEYLAAAESVAAGRPGWLAKGPADNPTQVMWPPAQPDPQNFKERLLYLDAQACKVLFGSSLIANTAPDSGTLAGGAHSETARRRIQAVALDVSVALQRQYDGAVLREAGLLAEGEAPSVYFELVDRRTVDPQKEIEWTAALSAAGWKRDATELAERTGMTLTEAPAQPNPAQGFAPMLPNRSGRLGDLPNNYDPSQPRDGDGEWSDTGGGDVPPRIHADEADAALKKGFTEKAANGKEVHFGSRLKVKLDSMPDGVKRKEFLEWGREAVRSGKHTPQEVDGELRDYYAKVFQAEKRGRGALVIVDAKDGEAFNLFASEPRYLKRKGYTNRLEWAEPGEQPPDGVLQVIAAAGGLPDWFNHTTPRAFVNRTPTEALRDLGERVAVKQLAKWDAPARLLFERLAKRIEDGEWNEEALKKLSGEIEALTVEDVTDPDALADFLERAMAGAVVDAVESRAKVVHP